MTYAYIRFSTDKQDEKQQINTIENYLKGKDLVIDSIVYDKGVSGGVTYKERNLNGLVNEMKAGDVLIVSEISRLGRSMCDINILVNQELKPRGIRLIIIKMGLDLDCSNLKAIDELMLSFFAFAAQSEKELIQDRTRSALEAKKKAGVEIGGTNNLWGKNTHADRTEAVRRAGVASGIAKRKKALQNAENKAFWVFMEDWQAINGKIGWQADWKSISEKLNIRGHKTASGLEFTPKRAKAMFDKLSKLYGNEAVS